MEAGPVPVRPADRDLPPGRREPGRGRLPLRQGRQAGPADGFLTRRPRPSAGVTKGALYHHFANKTDLFRAVLDQVQHEVADRVAATADARPDPWDRLVAGCRAFLEAATDPEAQQIMLIDGPAVLGWNEWRAMDEENSARHLADALRELTGAGVIPAQPVEPLVHLLSGAMNEAALWLARTGDPGALPATTAALTRLLDALRAP
ncbi:TetR/AcrR family transcriptional regulator [Actinomadura kijaniata]|uniref:TetR/AcrR family transcriptional regulator n=1 Tax=Actinomadura kijaniata TaxID=46161 RepID=UPI003F1C11A6